MSIQTPLSLAEIDEQINFDTLYQQALAEVLRLAGRVWTDKGEHDPGITMLQALAYAVSDVAYRHSLPLVDMLTPEFIGEQTGIFIEGFGPDRALTCGPVTEDDFRRGLLDLHTIDGNPGTDTGFLFRNAQLKRETAAEQLAYGYDPQFRKFMFSPPNPLPADYQNLTVAGTYKLYVELSVGVTKEVALPILQAYLRDNRNLCEQVREIKWPDAGNHDVHMAVELDDDCTDPARVLAQIWQMCLSVISPQATHSSVTDLQELGWTNDRIFQGPRLKHGWLTELPPAVDYSVPESVTLMPIAVGVLAIPGVAALRRLGWDSSQTVPPDSGSRPADRYIRPWTGQLSRFLSSVKVYKRGQLLTLTEEEVERYLPILERYDDQPLVVPFGRWRKPAKYYWAGQRLPPCYGLHNETPTPQQIQLHQFLLPFEQSLVDACSLLAELPDLLSFERRGDNLVWGEYRWPFDVGTVPDQVHAAYKQPLQASAEPLHHDADKELAIVDYLLSYFGENRADRTLWVSPADGEDFLEGQQGYLRNITDINYNRASLRIESVSALQQRIAARLGFGGAMFNNPGSVAKLPFYIIEHRALLPASPSGSYATPQAPGAVTAQGTVLTLTGTHLELQVGQLIDLLIVNAGGEVLRTISQIMVRTAIPTAFSVSTLDHGQFSAAFDAVVAAGTAGLRWQSSNVWLEDMQYRLAYAAHQPAVGTKQKRLTLSPYPLDIAVADKISIDRRSEVFNADGAPRAEGYPMQATVVSVEPLLGTMVVSVSDLGLLPTDPSNFRWHVERGTVQDNFSFVISVVFRRSTLVNTDEPELKAAWFEQVVRAEVPAHITVHLHWLGDNEFDAFADDYQAWQNNGEGAGDRVYNLLEALSIGLAPAGNNGIGARQIVPTALEGMAWDEALVNAEQLFYVPPES